MCDSRMVQSDQGGQDSQDPATVALLLSHRVSHENELRQGRQWSQEGHLGLAIWRAANGTCRCNG